MKIFGHEPAWYTGLFEVALVLLLSFHTLGLTADSVAAIMAVVTAAFGFYTAWVTKDTLLGVGVGLLKAMIALAAAYKFNFSADQVAGIIGLASVLLAGFQRTQTSAVAKPNLNPNPKAEVNRQLLAA
jgi:hypothetical protein